MAAYFIVQVKVTDAERYEDYRAGFQAQIASFPGKVIAADNDYKVMHGASDATRVIILEFASADELEAWYHSPAYQEIAKIRYEATESLDLLVHGR